jgi:uncharacterized oxidoreductase
MTTSNNTILITGGSAGIGFELAKLFSSLNNKVIITGRNEQRLQQAAAQLKNVTAITGDVSVAEDVDRLAEILNRDHKDLNIVINNAGAANGPYSLADEKAGAFERASSEMLTNFLSIIRLNERLLPLLRAHKEAAIVNVTSIVSIVPNHALPTYGASKAALHSYTESLRFMLAGVTAIKVFELRPPLVDTEFSASIGGQNGIAPSVVAEDLLKGMRDDNFDILVGRSKDIYDLYLSSPEKAFQALNTTRKI